MAYQVPLNQPLTETQSELIAKVGSMKNLLSLNFFQRFKIPKGEQISTFDYILKIMRAMGVDPVVLLSSFISSFLETDKLVDVMLRGTAQLAAGVFIVLDPESPLRIIAGSSREKRKAAADSNYEYLNSNDTIKTALRTVINALKMQIIKDLMLLIFGNPKKDAGIEVMTSQQDEGRLEEILNESFCGTEIFSVSSPANNRNEDLEYNRIKMKEQIKAGKAFFRVSCSGVDISFPDNPSYLFSDSPPGVVSSSYTTPAQSLANCIGHVSNQTQKITTGSGQGKAAANQKSFSQLLIEKLITHITILLKPFFMGVIQPIDGAGPAFSSGYDGLLKEFQNLLFSQGRNAEAENFNPNNLFPPSSCDILLNWDGNPDNWTEPQKKQSLLLTILCNMVLNAAIGFLLSFLLKQVKAFIVKFFAKRAEGKAKRKAEKLKQQYMGGVQKEINAAKEITSKIKKQKEILTAIGPAINYKENNYIFKLKLWH